MDTTPLVPPSKTRPPTVEKPNDPNSPIFFNFKVTTYILFGACVQSLAFALLPPLYASLPAATLLLGRLAHTFLVTFRLFPNPYLKNAIFLKQSPQVPDRDGHHTRPGQEKVAVFLLAFKINHPLGLFANGAKELSDYGDKMFSELEGAENQDNGFLGSSNWHHVDANGAREILVISYWRSMDDVHRYALSPLHRKGIEWWWGKDEGELKHVGIMHELYEAPAGMWEGIAINYQPTLLGKTTFLRRGGEKRDGGGGQDEWISPVLEAKGPLRTHHGRTGKGGVFAAKGFAKDY